MLTLCPVTKTFKKTKGGFLVVTVFGLLTIITRCPFFWATLIFLGHVCKTASVLYLVSPSLFVLLL